MAAREISAGDAASMPSVPGLRFPGKTKKEEKEGKDGQSNYSTCAVYSLCGGI
jgi:hypothetical protein